MSAARAHPPAGRAWVIIPAGWHALTVRPIGHSGGLGGMGHLGGGQPQVGASPLVVLPSFGYVATVRPIPSTWRCPIGAVGLVAVFSTAAHLLVQLPAHRLVRLASFRPVRAEAADTTEQKQSYGCQCNPHPAVQPHVVRPQPLLYRLPCVVKERGVLQQCCV